MDTNFRRRISNLQPVISASAIYASGDQVGPGSSRIASALGATAGISLLQSIIIVDAANQKAAIDFVFWSAQPTVATLDNAPFAVTAAEAQAKYLGFVSVLTTDYASTTTLGLGTKKDIRMHVQSLADTSNPGRDLFVSLIVRGTPTYAAITDLSIDFVFE